MQGIFNTVSEWMNELINECTIEWMNNWTKEHLKCQNDYINNWNKKQEFNSATSAYTHIHKEY